MARITVDYDFIDVEMREEGLKVDACIDNCGNSFLIPKETIEELVDICGHERPKRKVLCQLKKGHKGSHSAVVFWE